MFLLAHVRGFQLADLVRAARIYEVRTLGEADVGEHADLDLRRRDALRAGTAGGSRAAYAGQITEVTRAGAPTGSGGGVVWVA